MAWSNATLDDLGAIFNGNSVSEKYKVSYMTGQKEGIPYIGTKDVGFDNQIEYESGARVPSARANGFKLAPTNTVLVCAEGGSAGRKIALTDRPVFFGNKLFAICPSADVCSRFVFYHCLTTEFADAFGNVLSGIIGGVSLSKFKQLPIRLPPLAEQRRIAASLDEAFAGLAVATANSEQNLKNARELFDSYLNSMLATRGPAWVKKRLPDVAREFGRGKSKHRPRNDPKLYGGPYPFVQTGDISNADHWLTSYTQTYSAFGLAQSRLWPKGTVCIAIVGATVGETAILEFDACFPDSVIGIIVDPTIADVEYVDYLLQAYKARLKEKGRGAARDNINLGTFESQLFPFPRLAEQQAIVKKLNRVAVHRQELTAGYKAKLAAISQLKQSLLHKAFSGKLASPPSQAIKEAAE